MDYRDYLRRLRLLSSNGLRQYGQVTENGREYPLLSFVSPGSRSLVITSGFHGNETSGPLTLLENAEEILDHAKRLNVGLHVYPCVNPSGFEAGTRYNASDEKPNNDFLRYEVSPGVWRGELRNGEGFLRWKTAHDVPKETLALIADLAGLGTPAAALDIHQDGYLDGQHVYAYAFGAPDPYRRLLSESSRHAAILRDAAVDGGEEGPGDLVRTDADGLIVHHDGSVTDYFVRRGTRFTAALETTTATPLVRSSAVNMIWIRGFIELVATGDRD